MFIPGTKGVNKYGDTPKPFAIGSTLFWWSKKL
jgi:hypothetical protein